MDPIEPIRLDMNFLHAAMARKEHEASLSESIRQHTAGLAETTRHHGVLEQQHTEALGAAQQKIQLDAADNVLKDPDATPFDQYTAINLRLKMMGGTKGLPHEDIPPDQFLDNAPAWKTFATKLDLASSAQSPEVGAAIQELSQTPWFMKRARQAIALKQQQDVQKGFQSMPTRAGQPALSPQESTAVQTSPPAQKAIAESAFPSAKDTAVKNEIDQRTAGLKVQEQTATYAYQAANKAMTPVFNMDAEDAHVKNLPTIQEKSPLNSRLSSKDQTDQSALMAGTLTSDERQAAKTAIPEAMKDMNQQARALQQELHNAKNDVMGQSRPPEQIQADLQAIRTAVTIKGKELAYLANPTTPNRLAVKQAYEAFQKDLDQKKAEVLRLRQASTSVAQETLDSKNRELQLKHDYEQRLIKAQADFGAGGTFTPVEAAKHAQANNVLTQDVLKGGEDINKPQVQIDMSEKAGITAAKEFMQSTRTTYDQLKNAPAQLKNLAEAKALIPKAKGFMGPGGESLLEAAKFMNNRLGFSINTEGVKGAEELRSRIFFNVMDNLKKMDAQPSQMQQVIMMDSLGKLGTDPMALTNVLNAYEDSIRNKVSVHNAEVEGAMQRKVPFPYDPRIKLPPQSAREESALPQSTSPTATGPNGQKLILKDGKWQTLK